MKFKRICALFLTICCMIPCTGVFAGELSQTSSGNIGVSTEVPSLDAPSASPRGTSAPSTGNIYDRGVANKVRGNSDHSDLFTNSWFTGITSSKCYIYNYNSSHMTVSFRQKLPVGKLTTEVSSYKALAYGQGGKTFSNLDSSKYYLYKFIAPCNFEGNVYGYK